MKKFIKIFNKVNGREKIEQYIRAHVFFLAVIETIILGLTKKSLEIVRLAVYNRIVNRLRRKYKNFILNFMENDDDDTLSHQKPNKIWFCWLQGMENAPFVVKKCYESLHNNISNREIIVITEKNYKDYVTFPSFIETKIKKGQISRTHFSDLLRLELLIRYGGTWIDATVYCSTSKIPSFYLDSSLFLFQNLKPGLDGQATRISSWFITSCSNNKILRLTRSLLYEYWKTNSTMVDYFLLHDFFELAIEANMNEWENVIPVENGMCHVLLLRLFKPYDEKVWNNLKDQIPFHKLTYKYDESKTQKKGTYFDKILKVKK